MVRQMAHEETKRIYTNRVKEAIAKAVQKALSDPFQIGIEYANDVL